MTGNSTRLVWLEIRGFRAFGTEPRRLTFDAPLVVVHAGNSQGKTSLAEALEFLISGHNSRRELLGGAKAEYYDSLRNAHLPPGDDDVYIEAAIRGRDGVVHQVRRELVCDFGRGTECESRLLIDGKPADSLAALGLPMSDPPVRAPVLLQHTLRHVLSTEPKQRVGYFKAVLSLTDLDLLRERVAALRSSLDREPVGAALRATAALTPTPAGDVAAKLRESTGSTSDRASAAATVEEALLDAGAAILGTRSTSLDELRGAVEAALDAQRENVFPLAALTISSPVPDPVSAPGFDSYTAALAAADRRAARLAPVLAAVLRVDEYATLDHPTDCPVCATPSALTPQRLEVLRDLQRRTREVDTSARNASGAIDRARRQLDELVDAVRTLVPAAAHWSEGEVAEATARLRELEVDETLAGLAQQSATKIANASAAVERVAEEAREELDRAAQAVAAREELLSSVNLLYERLGTELHQVSQAVDSHRALADELRTVVEAAVRDRATGSGLVELADVVHRTDELVADVATETGRRRAVKRLVAAERAMRGAAGRVLDGRFTRMSDTIGAWWATIRPEELVGFGGVKRRAGGALFVNLIAALRSDATGEPVERDALGVYSDSQLNALGLSIFLARTELIGLPVVVLDDPIPGSDADHRLTFVQNTLTKLLDAGTQVILTTFDSKLADWAQSNHDWRGLVAYQLTLLDAVAGTEPTQTSDTFNRLLLEAEENLHAPTPRMRRAACGSLRSAAERLAKQIIATARTNDGQPCSVGDIEAEASVLGDLVRLVSGYALDNEEKGKWRTFAKVLNPGNHDDDVPSTTDLKQVRGNLRKIAKNHREHWPNGLLL
ncbi:AAA family ATPase [Gandjariella thermophila]|uniref:Nuclease SbcCD subunit C n=1 Tax=Gandjariella thermophila TaxID=1931992 RepID=A0A4D4JGV7_9PSEU|nr:AAA family ATPase [Gandjariella thermophila]GDY33868.1 hypothetical protein GTS_55010 [Gandjariella thermophila]